MAYRESNGHVMNDVARALMGNIFSWLRDRRRHMTL